MAKNKENKKKSGIGLAVWVVAALLLLIVFLVTRVKMLTVLKETDFFNKVFGSEPEFITNFTPEKSSEPEAEAEITEEIILENISSANSKGNISVEVEKEIPVEVSPKPEIVVETPTKEKTEEPKKIEKTETQPVATVAKMDQHLFFIVISGDGSVIRKEVVRQISKLKSTYVDGLRPKIKENGRVHTTFMQTVTATGRLSSIEPNLQNIPVRLELGSKIRTFFVGEKDKLLLDSDYSQIELRVLAHIAKDKLMIDAFNHDIDIHSATASQVFDVDIGEITSEMRRNAKAVNFGIVYGMGDYSLSQDLHISVKEAKAYIESYFEKYANVKKYLDTTVAHAKEKGFVTTLFGRRRYIPEINATNFMQRSFGERVAMNTPIQGTAADIIKIAMVNVHRELKNAGLNAKLILQVHDELIIEAPKSEVEKASKILEECMVKAALLSVPLLVESGTGESWYDAH